MITGNVTCTPFSVNVKARSASPGESNAAMSGTEVVGTFRTALPSIVLPV